MARAPTDLKREIATARTDPHQWLFGDRISPDDSTLASRGQGRGLALYDDLERDGQVWAVLQKRRAALIGRPWEVEAADDTPAARRAAELVAAQIKRLGCEGLLEELLGALLKGIAIVEIMWDAGADGIAPVAAKGRDPRRFAFSASTDRNGRVEHELRLLTRAAPLDGEAVPARKFVVHRFGVRYDNPWGLGLGHRLFWPVFFKRKGVGFWLGALEKFGQPTALGRYQPGTPEAEQKKLLAALQAIATDAGVIVPEGMAVELLEAKRGGTFESYQRLAEYMDGEIAKIVLGETLTTSVGESGSRALGDVHNAVRLELTRADADQMSRTLNATLVRWIVDLNLPDAPPPRLWWDVSEPEDLAALAARDEALARIGYRPTLDRVTDLYGEGYEAIAPPAAGSSLPSMFAERGLPAPRGRSAAAPRAQQDAADVLAEQLGALLAEGDDPLADALEALVARAASLEEVRDGLVALLPAISDARLGELMAQALIVANLQGRADLADGVDIAFADAWRSQPRRPAGTEGGGQWTSADGEAWSRLVASATGLARRSRIEQHAIAAGVPRERLDAFVDDVRAQQEAARRALDEASRRARDEGEAHARSPEGAARRAAADARLAAMKEAQRIEEERWAQKTEQKKAEYRAVPIREDWDGASRNRYDALVDRYSAPAAAMYGSSVPEEIEREARLATVAAIERRARAMGWTVNHRSTEAGRASSRYLVAPDMSFEVRVSDHHLPQTQDREFRRERSGPRWQLDIVVDDWQQRRVADYLREMQDAAARARGV